MALHLGVGTECGYRALLHHQEPLAGGDGAEPVGDDDHRHPAFQLGEGLLEEAFRMDVEGTGRLVQHEQVRFPTRERAMARRCRWPPESPLPQRSQLCVEPARQLLDLLGDVGPHGSGHDLIPCDRLTVEGDVVRHRARKQTRVLRHEGHETGPVRRRQLLVGAPVDEHRSGGWQAQAQQHLNQRRLAAPRRADDPEPLSGLDVQVQVPKGGLGAVAVGHVAQRYQSDPIQPRAPESLLGRLQLPDPFVQRHEVRRELVDPLAYDCVCWA